MKPVAWGVFGLAAGMTVTVAVGACASICPDQTSIVWEVAPGTYHLDMRIDPIFLHGDSNYQMAIAPDGNSAIETFVRDGKTHQTVYSLGPGSNSPVRTDLTPAHD
jgi:hypothetical protein